MLRRARVAVAVVFFVNGAAFAAWASRVPAIRGELGLSDAQLGLALLGLAVGAVLGLPAAGVLVARWGSVAVVRASLVIFCGSLALLPWSAGLVWLTLALTALGLGNSVLDVSMNTHGVEVERGYGRQILGGFHALFSFGGLAGALAGSAAAATGVSPRQHLTVAAFVLVTVGLGATRFMLPGQRDMGTVRQGLVRPDRTLWVLGAVAFCCMLCEGVANDWSAVYVQDGLGGSPAVAAAAFAAFSLTMAVGRLFADRVAMRFGRPRFLAVAGVLAGGGFGLGLAVPTPLAAVIGFALLGAGLAGVVPAMFSAAAEGREQAAPAISTVATMGYFGFLAGPPLIGALAQASSLRAALLVAVVLLVISLPAGAVVLSNESRRAHQRHE
ncbi:MAG: MFS transporter [Pseudonocardia sp.]